MLSTAFFLYHYDVSDVILSLRLLISDACSYLIHPESHSHMLVELKKRNMTFLSFVAEIIKYRLYWSSSLCPKEKKLVKIAVITIQIPNRAEILAVFIRSFRSPCIRIMSKNVDQIV